MKTLGRSFACAAAFLLAACDNPAGTGAARPEVLFVRRDGTSASIFAMHPDGSGEVQLTLGNDDDCPRWSPDGRTISFTRERVLEPGSTSRTREIHLMRADGSGVRRISLDRSGACADWAPDGRRLVYDAPDFQVAAVNVYVMDAGGGNRVQLTRNSWASNSPRWSPDGRRIVFLSGESGELKLWIMNADGSGRRAVGESCAGYSSDPSWSPDGSRLAFVCGSGPEGDVYVIGVDGTGERRLDPSEPGRPGVDSQPVWSPDGRRILAARINDLNRNVYSFPADGGAGVRITTDASWEAPFDWR
ncbi:PD40 domain-containing protein [Longimicrobium terrae]|uniref:Tol biopolymer transport system component n=1 Tax=Longimicrobium terrae TaxID=1639882 RepID=A0A841GUL2_9BACT|nr:PD40 domain-containing protein [Longimicrobium terrae]MBB4634012.1 Tol biopolymer transport system component [Longimicrobium terrae]MBB6069098.1 Tol biopolymer transport system component [Longimicrobium terrae]NNC28272.1 hypothetical protein [Longimicrobium terrae]